jgi:hypothetical protein
MRAAEDSVEIFPVVVVMRVFPARPSSVPAIREFVRQQLGQTPMSADDINTLCQRAADVLLDAAGTGGAIQVLLRIFSGRAEVDVLQTNDIDISDDTTGTAGAVNGSSPGTGQSRPESAPEPPSAPPAGRMVARPDVTFAAWLADALRREGMTMEAAARRLQVSVKTVSRWVGGVTEPRLRDLSRLREIFGDLPFP